MPAMRAQLGVHAVGGDQEPGIERHAVGQMDDAYWPRAAFEGLHADAFDDVDAERGGVPAQRRIEHLVGDHVGERLARRRPRRRR